MSGIELAKLIKQRKRSRARPDPVPHRAHRSTTTTCSRLRRRRGRLSQQADQRGDPASKVGVFVDLFRKTRALAARQRARCSEEMSRAREGPGRAPGHQQDLERRVQERTAALTRAHQGVRENEERWRMAMQVAQIAAWEWQPRLGRDDVVHRSRGVVRLSQGLVRSRAADPAGASSRGPARIEETIAIRAARRKSTRPNIAPCGRTAASSGSRSGAASLTDANGLPERMVGISRDVTDGARSVAGARAPAEERARGPRRSRASEPAEGRVPRDAEPRAAHADERRCSAGSNPARAASRSAICDSTLALIQRNAQIQAKLIDDLLDMNRLMSGNVRLEIAPLDVVGTVQATMQGLQPAADAKRHAARRRRSGRRRWKIARRRAARAAGALEPRAQRDQVHRQRRPGRSARSAARTREGADRPCRTTASGISPAFLPYVFERFRQEDSSTTREAFGLGLGPVDCEAPRRAARRDDHRTQRWQWLWRDVHRARARRCARGSLCHGRRRRHADERFRASGRRIGVAFDPLCL